MLYDPGRKGAVLPPITVDFVPHRSELVFEETFGPVIPIVRVPNDDDEVIRISNSTPFGLSSGVCTNRLDRITRFIEGLDVGTVNIWEVPGYRIEMSPFGGIKDSGNGIKEGVLGGDEVLHERQDLVAALARMIVRRDDTRHTRHHRAAGRRRAAAVGRAHGAHRDHARLGRPAQALHRTASVQSRLGLRCGRRRDGDPRQRHRDGAHHRRTGGSGAIGTTSASRFCLAPMSARPSSPRSSPQAAPTLFGSRRSCSSPAMCIFTHDARVPAA